MIVQLKKDYTIHHDENCSKITHKLQDHAKIDKIAADACNNLATVYEIQGDLEQAKKFYDESLQLRKLVHGFKYFPIFEYFIYISFIYILSNPLCIIISNTIHSNSTIKIKVLDRTKLPSHIKTLPLYWITKALKPLTLNPNL